MTIERIRTFEDLSLWLEESEVRYRVDDAARSAEVTIDKPRPLTGSLALRWVAPFIEIEFPFVLDVPDSRLADVETAIVRANNIIALPGLGFDYAKHSVHMRNPVRIDDDGVDATAFKAQVFGVLGNAKDFIGAFQAIVGGRSGAEVMQLAVEAAQANAGADA